MILAYPMGKTKFGSKTSSDTLKDSLYIISFSKNTTGFGFLIAAFNNPLASSASYGQITTNPGTDEYQDAKH